MKESNGCYDLSVRNVRQCLVINKTTSGNIGQAEEDCSKIDRTMKSLNFDVRISNVSESWKDNLEKCKFS